MIWGRGFSRFCPVQTPLWRLSLIFFHPHYFTTTKFLLHTLKLRIKIPLYFLPPDGKYKDLLSSPVTFSGFGAKPVVLRQLNASLLILEAVWDLSV